MSLLTVRDHRDQRLGGFVGLVRLFAEGFRRRRPLLGFHLVPFGLGLLGLAVRAAQVARDALLLSGSRLFRLLGDELLRLERLLGGELLRLERLLGGELLRLLRRLRVDLRLLGRRLRVDLRLLDRRLHDRLELLGDDLRRVVELFLGRLELLAQLREDLLHVLGRPAARRLRLLGVAVGDLRLLDLQARHRLVGVEAVFDGEERDNLLDGFHGGDGSHFKSL